MATQTPNLGLKKPAGTDYVRINDFNENADTLDGKIGKLSYLETNAKENLVVAINEARATGGTNAPYIGENGNWWQWDYTTSQFIDTGVPAEGLDGNDGADGTSAYVWIKWSLVPPTQDSDMQSLPADYIGIYAGTSPTAPTTYTSYIWYRYKGGTGDTGPAGADGENGPPNVLSIGTVQSGTEADATITGDAPNQTLNLVLPEGPKGNTGRGITSIQRTSGTGAPGTTDTYTITYTDNTTSQFQLYNGSDGADGEGGDTGPTGDTGNGIASVTLISGNHAPGTLDTYRIAFTDTTTYDFYVYNGADGTGAGDMLKATYDPNNKNGDAFSMGNMVETATAKIMTEAERNRLAGIEANAQANVKSDWNAPSGDAEILNKPTLGTLAAKDTVTTADIADASVTNAKLANMAAYTVKGRNASSAGVPGDVTMLDVAEYGLFQGTTATSVADAEFVSVPVSATSLKKITWANVKATLKTYFDTLYAKVADILALGETSSTAYRGDRGKAAYDHSQIDEGNPHGTTAAEVGADASGTAASAVSTHNNDSGAHSTQFAGKAGLDGDGKVLADQASSAIVSITANTTLALTHAGKLLSVSNASDRTITIPTNSSVAFPVGTEIEVLRYGAGAVTIAAADGVTLRSAEDKVSIDKQYTAAALKKLGTNEWLLVGGLS